MSLWYNCGGGWAKTYAARKHTESTAIICCPGPSLADVNDKMLHHPGVTVVGVTTSYPKIRPHVWIGMDYPWCYDARLHSESFTKIARAGMKDKLAGGRPWHTYPGMVFADVTEGSLDDVFFRRGHEEPFLWRKDTLSVAIHYALWTGHKRIALVGCDCGGSRDYHDGRILNDEHRAYNRRLYQQQIARLWHWAAAGEPRGVEIVSATPGSPINAGMAYIPVKDIVRRAGCFVRKAAVFHVLDKPEPVESKKPVLLHLNHFMLVGGAELYICAMTRALPEYEHRVCVQGEPDTRMVRVFAETAEVDVQFAPKASATDLIAEHAPQCVVWHTFREPLPGKMIVPCVRVWHGCRPEQWKVEANVAVSQSSVKDRQGDWVVIPGAVRLMPYCERSGKPVLGSFSSDRNEKFDAQTMRVYWDAISAGADVLCVGNRRSLGAMADCIEAVPASVLRKHDYLRRMHLAVYRNAKRCVEGYSLAICEMMMAGIPVVAEARGGMLDQIEHGRTGFLIEWADIEGFCRIVTELIADPARCRKIGMAAHEFAVEHMGFSTFASRWRHVLTTVARQRYELP